MAINFPLWVTCLMGLIGLLIIIGLGALHFHAHIPAVVEKITVKFMTHYTKRNYSVQEQILKELKKLNKK